MRYQIPAGCDVEQVHRLREAFVGSDRLFEACLIRFDELEAANGGMGDYEALAVLDYEATRLVNDDTSPFYITG